MQVILFYIFSSGKDTAQFQAYIKCMSLQALLKSETECRPTSLLQMIQDDHFHFGLVNKSIDVQQCTDGKLGKRILCWWYFKLSCLF